MGIYEGLPETFMSPEIHDFLSRFINNRYKKLLELENTQQHLNLANAFKQRAASREITMQHPQGSMTVFASKEQVAHALGQVREIARWVGELQKSKQISSHDNNEVLLQAKDYHDRASCDMEIFEAMEMENRKGPRAAVFKYRDCLKALAKLNYSETLDRQMYEVRKHLAGLEEQVEELKEQELAEMKAAEEEKKRYH